MGMWMQGGVDEDDKLDVHQTRKILNRTFRRLGPYRRRGFLAVFFLTTWTAATLAGPLLVRVAIDDGIRARDLDVLNRSTVFYVLAAIVAYGTYRGAIFTLARVGEEFLRDLRRETFDRLTAQSLGYFDRNKGGVLVSRMTSDIDSLSELVQFGLLMFLVALFQLVATTVLLAFLQPLLLLLCLVTMPILVVASRKFQRDSNVAYLKVRDGIGATLSSLQEGINGTRVVQAFAREEAQAKRFASTSEDLYDSHMASVRIAAWYLPIIEFSGTLTTAIAIGVGAGLVSGGSITVGTVVAFVLLLQGLFEPVQQLSQLFNLVQSAVASLSKIYEVIDAPTDVPEPERPQALPRHAPLSVDDVTFSYLPGARVLENVSLELAAGERLALVGPTGAGKSTLAKVIARFYEPDSGSISVGGVDLRSASSAELRERIVVIPQEGHLFSGTIAENLRLALPGATDDELAASCARLGVLERIQAFPDGFQTDVWDRGSRLSAGERQLISLARAALVDPDVLILDEATSSLDPGTEQLIEQALERLMEGRTVIVIAHRLSTAERADRVGVVDQARLLELGTHDELVAAGGAYSDLYAAWTR